MAVAIAALEVVWSYFLLSLIGFSIVVNFPRSRSLMPIWLSAPLLGLGVIQVFGWYWLANSESGLRSGFLVIALIAIGCGLIGVLRNSSRVGISFGSHSMLTVGAVLILSLAIGSLFLNGFFQAARPTAATIANNDIASYALLSQHLADHGFDSPGSVVGADQGGVSEIDASGVRVVLTFVSVVTNQDVQSVTAATVLLFIVVLALASVWVVGQMSDVNSLIRVIIAILVVSSSMIAYLLGNYFLSQVASMASVMALLGVLLVSGRRQSRADMILLGFLATAVLVPMVLTYPHMAVIGLAVTGGSVIVGGSPSGFLKRSVRVGFVAIASAVGSVVILLPHVPTLVERARFLANVAAGWPLPISAPFRTLGLEKFGETTGMLAPTPAVFWTQFAAIGLILVGVGALRLYGRSIYPFVPLALFLIIIVGYRVAIAQRGGNSYGQWKWITFYQPLIVVSVAIAVAELATAALRSSPGTRAQRVRLVVIAAPLLAWIAISINRASSTYSRTWSTVPSGLSDVAVLERSNLTSINVDLAPYWESMWAAYYLSDLQVHIVNPSYYAPSSDPSSWTLRRAPDPSSDVSIADGYPYSLDCAGRSCRPSTVDLHP